MNFSYEEIFSMYGQFDTFVSLQFHPASEAHKKYGQSLMGTFIYTLNERRDLEQVLKNENVPRTNKYIKFKPAKAEKRLTREQRIDLDKKGILNGDIFEVATVNRTRQNRFKVVGEKDVPNTLKVNFDPRGVEWNRLKLGMYSSRLASGYPLIESERYEYLALRAYCEEFSEDEKREAIDANTGRLKPTIRYHFLEVKFMNTDLTPEEDEEFKRLQDERSKPKMELLRAELTRSSERLKDLAVHHKDPLNRIIVIAAQFEDDVILPYEFPIWWNFERFLHIYIRHVKETKVGERFAEKTIFQYKFKDVRRIIDAVLTSIYPEVEEHFRKTTDIFRRMGKRAVYYDGIYYRVEIESNGLLRTFHPENATEVA
jgi:hypothetical protein